MLTDDLFTIEVPQENLDAPKGGGSYALPEGEYKTTLQFGISIISGKNGWQAFSVPTQGYKGLKGKTAEIDAPNRDINAKFAFAHDTNKETVRIGREAIIGLAKALGLTTDVTLADGRAAVKMTAKSNDEFIEQVNAMAGAEVGVYITAKPGDKLRNDGTPFINNDIVRFFAL